MLSVPRTLLFVCLTILFYAPTAVLAADEKPAADEGELLESWAKLIDRRDDAFKQLNELQQAYPKAKPEDKKGIKDKFDAQVKVLREEIFAELIKLAPKVLKQEPGNVDAADLVIEQLMRENHFEEVAAISDTVLKAGKTSPGVLIFGGMAHFNIHNFEKAKELLTKAQQQGGQFAQQAEDYLSNCEDYIKYWEKEKKLRAAEAKADDLPRVEFDTTKGKVVLELFENEAPNSVANFITTVESGAYNGNTFHRVIPNFMAQGGQTGSNFTIDCECYREDHRKHFRGSLSMAHRGKDTGSTQFFITHLPTAHLNQEPNPAAVHTVFGRVIEGMSVVESIERGDRIKTAKVLRKRDHDYTPVRKKS